MFFCLCRLSGRGPPCASSFSSSCSSSSLISGHLTLPLTFSPSPHPAPPSNSDLRPSVTLRSCFHLVTDDIFNMTNQKKRLRVVPFFNYYYYDYYFLSFSLLMFLCFICISCPVNRPLKRVILPVFAALPTHPLLLVQHCYPARSGQ